MTWKTRCNFEDDGQVNREVITRIQSGDKQAFSELYQAYVDDLYFYIRTFVKHEVLTEETVQEVFIKVWEKRYALGAIHSLKSYLFTIANNLVISHYRKEATRRKYLSYVRVVTATTHNAVENNLISAEYEQIARTIIEQLPPKRQEIYRLSRERDMSYAEIAAYLGTSVKHVEKQMSKALKSIKAQLHIKADIIISLLVCIPIIA